MKMTQRIELIVLRKLRDATRVMMAKVVIPIEKPEYVEYRKWLKVSEEFEARGRE